MVEVVVLTGFLGSGKTTLLNRMIAARGFGADLGGPGRLALIVNELGEVGIDGALLPADLTRQVELPGGCICCVLNEDLDRTLLDLLASAPDVSTIVIETTGVAEPMPIAWSLEREPLASRLRLAAVVTLVDVTHLESQRALSPAVDSQIAYADIAVLTKTDLATAVEIDRARAVVAALAPRVPVVTGTPDQVVAWLGEALADPELPRPGRQRALAAIVAPSRGHGIDSVWAPIDELVDLEELCDRLAELPAEYVRIKGIAHVVDPRTGNDAPHWAVFHRVGLRVSSERLEVGSCELVDRRGPGRVVALGPGVSRDALAACVRRAVLS